MKTIYLDRNESQYDPPEACMEILRSIAAEHLTHYTRDYDRGVKSRVSERLAEWLGLPESNVLLGYGTESLLKMAVHHHLSEGQFLMVPEVSWWYYGAIGKEVGAPTCTYRVFPDGRTFHYRMEDMLRVYELHQPRVVFVASPNNPTGHVMPIEMLRELLRHFKQSVVVVDEAYWGYHSLESAYVKSLVTEFDNVMICRSFSKYYGLAGVRMGYAAISERFREFARYTTLYLGYNQLSERLVLAAMDHPEHYRRIADLMSEDKNAFYSELAVYPGITCYRSDANFLLVKLDPAMTDLLKARLDSLHIKIKFFADSLLKDHVRISLGKPEQNRLVLDSLKAVADRIGKDHADVAR